MRKLSRRYRRKARGDSGAAAVEFALVSIPLFVLLFGIIQFGFIFYTQITLSQAAREGARAISLCDSTQKSTCSSDAIAKAKSGAYSLTLSDSNFTPAPVTCAGADVTKDGTVTITYTVNSLLFNITLTGKASMPCGG